MNHERINRRVSVAEAIEMIGKQETPSKDLPYWAGSAERAKARMKRQQEAVDKRKIQCQRDCPQDCADCVVEVD